MRYRKIPKEIEAIQWTGENLKEMCQFFGLEADDFYIQDTLYLPNASGSIKVTPGDYVVEARADEYYVCRASIFKDTYELVK